MMVIKAVSDNAKCIKQHVLNVNKNAKFHSNLLKEDQFIVGNVSERIKAINS
jgi:hypothetical protein